MFFSIIHDDTLERERERDQKCWSLIASGQKNLHNSTSNTQRIQMIMMWMMNLNEIFFIHSLIQGSL
jgi:hypothetical protein